MDSEQSSSSVPTQMDQDQAAAADLPLLYIGVRATASNADYIRRMSPWALLDLSGANLTQAMENLPPVCSSHSGQGTVCGQLAISAHASQQCLLGFGANPECAQTALYSAEDAIKLLSQVDLNSTLHSTEISFAHSALRQAACVVQYV